MLAAFIFWSAAVIAIGSTLAMLLSRNPFYAVLYLIQSLFGVALIFYTLGAEFLAVLEIIVYAGAIMVLFLFVVQMLSPGSGPTSDHDLQRPSIGQSALPILFAVVLLAATALALFKSGSLISAAGHVTYDAKSLGIALFRSHYLGVELASLVLLIGMIGAMHLGRAATTEVAEAANGVL